MLFISSFKNFDASKIEFFLLCPVCNNIHEYNVRFRKSERIFWLVSSEANQKVGAKRAKFFKANVSLSQHSSTYLMPLQITDT